MIKGEELKGIFGNAIDAAVAEEREQCAIECERMMMYEGGKQESPAHNDIWDAAKAIRSRGQARTSWTATELDAGNISDGYHTFNELYAHRCHLFVALMGSNPDLSWRASVHEDGTMYDGFFVAGMRLPTGDISYHLPMTMWGMLDGVQVATTDKAPKWDGHTSADTVARLAAWCNNDD